MTDKLLNLMNTRYSLTPIDVGEMAKLKANGMTFIVSAYRAEGLGHVSVMRAKGFFGFMKMDTLIINHEVVDLPLYSYDRIFAAGNDTLIVELYDSLVTGHSVHRRLMEQRCHHFINVCFCHVRIFRLPIMSAVISAITYRL